MLTQAFILIPLLAQAQASASTLSLLERYMDKNLKKTIKLLLKLFIKG